MLTMHAIERNLMSEANFNLTLFCFTLNLLLSKNMEKIAVPQSLFHQYSVSAEFITSEVWLKLELESIILISIVRWLSLALSSHQK